MLQKSLRSTLEQTRKATERVMTDIKDYAALRRRWEGERKTLKRQEEPKYVISTFACLFNCSNQCLLHESNMWSVFLGALSAACLQTRLVSVNLF